MPSDSFRLARRDILEMEQRLHTSLAQVLHFSSHAVYFPQEDLPPDPIWIEEERTLLIPLLEPALQAGEVPELLGVFAARGVEALGAERLAQLPVFTQLCMENLLFYKAGRLDPATGLSIRKVFEDRVSREIAAIQNVFAGGDESPSGGCFALVALRLAPLRALAREHGQAFAEELGQALACVITPLLPGGGLAARVGDTSFAVFLPGASRLACEQEVADMLRAMDGVRLQAPLSGQSIGVMVHAGYALYPQDIDGLAVSREPRDQAQRLIQRAALAASVAGAMGQARCMGYGYILAEGGRILRPLPLSRLVVSLGRTVGAHEGQRFAVHAPVHDGQAPVYKGELSLVKVHRDESEAEIVCLGEPGSPPVPGDILSLLPDSSETMLNADSDFPRDKVTGFLRHSDFLARLAPAQRECARFALVLVDVSSNTANFDDVLGSVTSRLRARFALTDEDQGVFGGRYGHHSILLFHPGAEPEALLGAYEAEAAALSRELGCRVGAGIAAWPFLQFRPSEMVECTRKALEYALLLPEPYVGLFGSLALNISADKRHCVGDVFGAVEEYKLALLADADNALAWNSLGVCMAALGHAAEARRHFEEALKRTPDDAALAYNLGAVCLDLDDIAAAEGYFETCLERDPKHLYTMVRLGQAAERRGDLESAKERYTSASKFENSGLPFRHLARLSLREERFTEAREQLQQALQKNPRDAVALQMMAGLYLDGGEDPTLAESLARHSVALNPERKNGWLVLARALELQGREAEARQARLRAGEM